MGGRTQGVSGWGGGWGGVEEGGKVSCLFFALVSRELRGGRCQWSVAVVCRRGSGGGGGGGGGWSAEAAVFGGLVRDRPSPCLLAGRWTQSRSALV